MHKANIEAPPQPSAKERDEHRLHHANFEAWCEVCVQGQGKDKHHKRKEESKEHIIYSDYLFFNKDGHIIDKETGLEAAQGLVTVLTAICKDSQFPFVIVVPAKGGNEYAIKALYHMDSRNLFGTKSPFRWIKKTHCTSSMMRLKKRMPEKKVKLRKSPRYSSQSLADGDNGEWLDCRKSQDMDGRDK